MRTGQRAERDHCSTEYSSPVEKEIRRRYIEPCCSEVSQPRSIIIYLPTGRAKTEAEQRAAYLYRQSPRRCRLPPPRHPQHRNLSPWKERWRTESSSRSSFGKSFDRLQKVSALPTALLNQRVRGNHFRVLAELMEKAQKATLADATFLRERILEDEGECERDCERKLCIKGKTGSKDAREVKYRHQSSIQQDMCVFCRALWRAQ